MPTTEVPVVEASDIQATVLRPRPSPYRGEYLILRIGDAEQGREMLRRIHPHGRFLRYLPQPENALLAIDADKTRAQNHGQVAGREAPRHVHLPETLLCGHVALCKEKVVKVRRSNRRNSQRIARHGHRLTEAREPYSAVLDGQRCANCAVEPDIKANEDNQRQR